MILRVCTCVNDHSASSCSYFLPHPISRALVFRIASRKRGAIKRYDTFSISRFLLPACLHRYLLIIFSPIGFLHKKRHGIHFSPFISVIFNLFLNFAQSATFSIISLLHTSICLLSFSCFPHFLRSCIPFYPVSLSSASFISQPHFSSKLLFLSLSFSVSGHTLGYIAEARPKRGIIYRGTRKESYG